MKIRLYRLIAVFCTLTVSCLHFGYAQQASLGAHVHGVSELNIAIEGNKLEIQMRSPAMNIVGFEHKASTQQQISSVKQSEVLLNQYSRLFSFSDAECALKESTADLSDLVEQGQKHKTSHDHHEDEHKHNKHGHDHEEHHTGHKEEHSEHSDHSEIVAHYHFECEDLDELSTLTLGFFDLFPSMQKINGAWITETGQGAATLTIDSKTIRFR